MIFDWPWTLNNSNIFYFGYAPVFANTWIMVPDKINPLNILFAYGLDNSTWFFWLKVWFRDLCFGRFSRNKAFITPLILNIIQLKAGKSVFMWFKCKWIDHRNRMKSYTKRIWHSVEQHLRMQRMYPTHLIVFVVDEGHSRGISIIFVLKGLSKIFSFGEMVALEEQWFIK